MQKGGRKLTQLKGFMGKKEEESDEDPAELRRRMRYEAAENCLPAGEMLQKHEDKLRKVDKKAADKKRAAKTPTKPPAKTQAKTPTKSAAKTSTRGTPKKESVDLGGDVSGQKGFMDMDPAALWGARENDVKAKGGKGEEGGEEEDAGVWDSSSEGLPMPERENLDARRHAALGEPADLNSFGQSSGREMIKGMEKEREKVMKDLYRGNEEEEDESKDSDAPKELSPEEKAQSAKMMRMQKQEERNLKRFVNEETNRPAHDEGDSDESSDVAGANLDDEPLLGRTFKNLGEGIMALSDAYEAKGTIPGHDLEGEESEEVLGVAQSEDISGSADVGGSDAETPKFVASHRDEKHGVTFYKTATPHTKPSQTPLSAAFGAQSPKPPKSPMGAVQPPKRPRGGEGEGE
ncbi:hypothetical protein T484DRAFT_1912582, partial [Baffinella frigidus]